MKKWIITLCIVGLVAATVSSQPGSLAATGAAADQPGAYKVGFVTRTYYDSTRSDDQEAARPIMTFIWYPAAPDNEGDPMSPAVYELGIPGGPRYASTDFEAYGVDPAYQEVAASQDGPFPLIVFSPGLLAPPLFYVHIGARLASHGFVVAIPYNYGDAALGETKWEFQSSAYLVGTYIDRTGDVQYLMTRLVADSSRSDDLLYGTIREDRIAVSGHSCGALAALALAGGDDRAFDILGPDSSLYPQGTDITILPDPRVKAIVPIDPAYLTNNLHYAEMARITIPSMVIGREWSSITESGGANEELLMARPHSAMQGQANYRVEIAHYQHMSFSSAYSCMNVLRGLNGDEATDAVLKMYSPKESVPPDETGNVITRYMIAFLRTVLVGDDAYRETLTSTYALANEPLVEFFETEKGNLNTVEEDGYFSYFMHQGGERATARKDPSGIE